MENDSRTVQKNEAVVSARDLLGAIVERVPRSGFGPGRIDSIPATVSAILFAMEQGMCVKTISSKCNSRNMLAQFSIGKLSYFMIFFLLSRGCVCDGFPKIFCLMKEALFRCHHRSSSSLLQDSPSHPCVQRRKFKCDRRMPTCFSLCPFFICMPL